MLSGQRLCIVVICFLHLACGWRVAYASSSTSSSDEGEPGWRDVYIAAEEIDWNYAPLGINNCTGRNFTGGPALWTKEGLGSVYKKAHFVEYSDANFQTAVQRPANQEHLGILGPLIRAVPGDHITVHFLNRLKFPVNIEPTGLLPATSAAANKTATNGYERAITTNETAILDFGEAAEPGQQVVYKWIVPKEAGPSANEPDTKLWMYRSTVEFMPHQNAALLGPILVSRPDSGAGTSWDKQEDIVTFFQIINENVSPYNDANVAGRSATDLGLESEGELAESGLKHTVNGYIFCNLPGINLKQGTTARWHVATIGSEVDLHNVHWHGNTILNNGHRTDQVKMIPGTAVSVTMDAREPGTWLSHCHVNDHIEAGMMFLFNVLPDSNVQEEKLDGKIRRYYIAAEDVMWDYAPLGGNGCSGQVEPWSDAALVFVGNGTGKIGSKYMKGHFFEYTDQTFTTRKERPAEDAYLGLLGPILKAEVGDTIEILFQNNMSSFYASMHPHGVEYGKDAEGSPYNDGTSGANKLDDAVAPGKRHFYRWKVPTTAGPGPNDTSTVFWMYHSHVNEVTDTYAGLVGGIIVGRKGAFDENGKVAGVDREVVLYFSVINEGESLYYAKNEALLAARDGNATLAANGTANGSSSSNGNVTVSTAVGNITYTTNTSLASSSDTSIKATTAGRRLLQEAEEEEYYMHSINGYVYCNMPKLAFNKGERVRFHFMVTGTEVDIHTPVLQQASFLSDGVVRPSMGMMPGYMATSDVTIQGKEGSNLLLSCRVADHVAAGMLALATVNNGSSKATTSTTSNDQKKTYYIAAEELDWDYAPLGGEACGVLAEKPEMTPRAAQFIEKTNVTIGSTYKKALYRGYTDDTFKTKKEAPVWHGILGPLITAETGQTLEIVFKNNLPFDANLNIDGGLETLEGSADPREPVKANGTVVTYKLRVSDSAGPGPADLNTVTYGYTSSVDYVTHPYAGLVGMMLVGRPGTFNNDKDATLPAGVNHIVPMLAMVVDENASPYLQANIEAAGIKGVTPEDEGFFESNLMHSINGFVFCNIPLSPVSVNSTVRVPILGMGSEMDIHAISFTGQVLTTKVANTHIAGPVMPAITETQDLKPSEAGRWLFFCEVQEHEVEGMKGTLVVE